MYVISLKNYTVLSTKILIFNMIEEIAKKENSNKSFENKEGSSSTVIIKHVGI